MLNSSDYNDIKLCEAPKNVAVYSGFYVIKNRIKQTDDVNKNVGKLIKDAVETKQFNDYIKVIGKSKKRWILLIYNKRFRKIFELFLSNLILFKNYNIFIVDKSKE